MDALQRIVYGRRHRRSRRPNNPTDEVIPLFFFDDTPFYRNAVGIWTLRFNDVLDPDRLHAALACLLEKDGWRKLGGRFQQNDQGKLEVHIPKAFSEERPAVNYSYTSFNIAIDEHAVAASYPNLGQHDLPSMMIPGANIWDLGLPSTTPRGTEDYLNSDSPLLTLHITSFTDATLVSLCWPHVAADAKGLTELAKAWSLVLAGRETEVQPMLSFRDDPMATAGRDQRFQEKHWQEHLLLTGFWLYVCLLRYLIDMLWWPKMESSGVFISKEAVQKLKAAAAENLPEPKPFISDGDVISAWACSMAASVLPPTSNRTVSILNAFDLRKRAPSLFPAREGDGCYIQNAVFPITTLVPARVLCSREGLGLAALEVRRTIGNDSQEAQVHALARLNRHTIVDNGLVPIFGDTSIFMINLSNWTKVGVFHNVDFGPTVLFRNSRTRSGVLESKPVFCQDEGVSEKDVFARNYFTFVEGPAGGYCIRGYLPPKVWRTIEQSMSSL